TRTSETQETEGSLAVAGLTSPTSPVKQPRVPDQILLPRIEESKFAFRLLQRWDGEVQLVNNGSMTAIIRDQTNPENPHEQVEISLDEIPADDHALIMPGAVFYWSIGYAEGPGKPRERVSRIRFRRLPAWTRAELNAAQERIKGLLNALRGT
ncbi:MAG: hypothetical protein WCZ87_03120, partial [Thiohalobacteraceae bacterium]